MSRGRVRERERESQAGSALSAWSPKWGSNSQVKSWPELKPRVRRSTDWGIQVPLYCILFIHLSVDGHLGCFYLLTIVHNATINTGVQIPVRVPAFNSLCIYPEAELLDHMVILCVSFWGATTQFSTAVAPFHTPTSSAQRCQVLHILVTWSLFLGREPS